MAQNQHWLTPMRRKDIKHIEYTEYIEYMKSLNMSKDVSMLNTCERNNKEKTEEKCGEMWKRKLRRSEKQKALELFFSISRPISQQEHINLLVITITI